MVRIKLLCHDSNPHTHTHGSQEDNVGRDHPSGMKPDNASEAQKSNDHGAKREEEDKRHGSENGMSHDDHVQI